MAAFNSVKVTATCPHCSRQASILAQTHIASTFDGDARGRFCSRTYDLGERMWWWPQEDERYPDWKLEGLPSAGDPEDVEEACYAKCEACGAELCVVLRFRALTPTTCVAVTTMEEWPAGFPR